MFLHGACAFIAKAQWIAAIIVSDAFVKNVGTTVAVNIALFVTDS